MSKGTIGVLEPGTFQEMLSQLDPGGEETVRVKSVERNVGGELESLVRTVNLYVPTVTVGDTVPEMRPVLDSVSPAGRTDPLCSAQL